MIQSRKGWSFPSKRRCICIMEIFIIAHSAMENDVHSIWKSRNGFPTSCKHSSPQLHKPGNYKHSHNAGEGRFQTIAPFMIHKALRIFIAQGLGLCFGYTFAPVAPLLWLHLCFGLRLCFDFLYFAVIRAEMSK